MPVNARLPNRLVKIADGSDTVSEYAYDGAKRRIVQKSYTGGVLDETRHLYYTQPSSWQVLEERLGTSPDSADPERQFVWGLRYIDDYIDDLVLRDRDTDGNGSLDERLCTALYCLLWQDFFDHAFRRPAARGRRSLLGLFAANLPRAFLRVLRAIVVFFAFPSRYRPRT
jgi:hypothetical protein